MWSWGSEWIKYVASSYCPTTHLFVGILEKPYYAHTYHFIALQFLSLIACYLAYVSSNIRQNHILFVTKFHIVESLGDSKYSCVFSKLTWIKWTNVLLHKLNIMKYMHSWYVLSKIYLFSIFFIIFNLHVLSIFAWY